MDNHKSKSRFWKFFFFSCLGVGIIILVLLAFLPAVLSTKQGKELFTSLINRQISGSLEVDQLSFTWEGPQIVEGLILKDCKGQKVASLQKGTIHTPLVNLLWKKQISGMLEVRELNANLVTDSNGNTNLQKILNKKCEHSDSSSASPITIQLRNVNADITTDGEVWSMHASGDTQQEALSGNFMIDSEIKDAFIKRLLLEKKEINKLIIPSMRNNDLKLHVKMNHFPTELIEQVAPSWGSVLYQLLGNQFNLSIEQRGLTFDIRSDAPNFFAAFKAEIDNGWVKLNNDLHATLTVTPQLSQFLLRRIPALSGVLSAEQPLKLTIEKEGFALSLNDRSWQSFLVDKATLELGKMRFSTQSQLAKTLNLLSSQSDSIAVWFTPLYFSMSNGILNLKRIDMLVNNQFPLATWGRVDLAKDKVNLIIGLYGASIGKVFNVQGINKSYLLKLPLRGSLAKASINKNKMAARIASLVAQSHGGKEGLILGTVLDLASGEFSEEKSPPPTTQPLPWNDLITDDPKDKTKQDPIEELGNKASSLLKQLLR